jgi:hypothetical protein
MEETRRYEQKYGNVCKNTVTPAGKWKSTKERVLNDGNRRKMLARRKSKELRNAVRNREKEIKTLGINTPINVNRRKGKRLEQRQRASSIEEGDNARNR